MFYRKAPECLQWSAFMKPNEQMVNCKCDKTQHLIQKVHEPGFRIKKKKKKSLEMLIMHADLYSSTSATHTIPPECFGDTPGPALKYILTLCEMPAWEMSFIFSWVGWRSPYTNPSIPDMDSFESITAARLWGAYFKRSFPVRGPYFWARSEAGA